MIPNQKFKFSVVYFLQSQWRWRFSSSKSGGTTFRSNMLWPLWLVLVVSLRYCPQILGEPGLNRPVGICPPQIHIVSATRIFDPKLDGGHFDLQFSVGPGCFRAPLVVELMKRGCVQGRIWSGCVRAGGKTTRVKWNGKRDDEFVTTGHYVLRIRDTRGELADVEIPLDIIRLGITEISARESRAGNDEWQMVYFMKGDEYAYYATPDIHEYLNKKETGEISDLDQDDGTPRPPPQVHLPTDSPSLEDGRYEDDRYNYPLCYLTCARPRLRVRFGDTATSASGQPMSVGYPVPGFSIRGCLTQEETLQSMSGPIAPNGTALFEASRLPEVVGRVDRQLKFHWEYRKAGATTWSAIPGSTILPIRFYTILGEPQFKEGASGIQYAGPWVEVAEYWHDWRIKQQIETKTESACIKNHVRGFFGKNPGVAAALEGMLYDAPPLGGSGGYPHYHNGTTWNMDLSALLNRLDNSKFVGCSDNMGATSTMLAMMGVRNVKSVRLEVMHLHNVWPIGATSYTMPLFHHQGSHYFSYHHVVTRDDATHIIDTCIQLDEDCDRTQLPGVRGWNDERIWAGPMGYEEMSSSNSVTYQLQELPGLN